MTESNKQHRIAFISLLQFVGVVSVIFGHSMNSIAVPTVLINIKSWVYTYHMPLFFFVSAFLFSYKGGYDRGIDKVFKNRLMRLILPYLIWNILFIIPKVLFRDYINDRLQFSVSFFIKIILRPRDSILGHTWFLVALFEMYIAAVLLDKATKKKELWAPIGLALVIVHCFGVTSRWLAVGDLMKNGIFFWCGLLMGKATPSDIEWYLTGRRTLSSLILLTLGTSAIWMFKPDMAVNTLVLGFSVIMLVIALQGKLHIEGDLIEFVAINSFSIYIMHWPVIMLSRLVFYQKMELAPVTAMVLNGILGFAIPSLISLLLRKLNSPRLKKIRGIVFGM